jgi:hypothetical protein
MMSNFVIQLQLELSLQHHQWGIVQLLNQFEGVEQLRAKRKQLEILSSDNCLSRRRSRNFVHQLMQLVLILSPRNWFVSVGSVPAGLNMGCNEWRPTNNPGCPR